MTVAADLGDVVTIIHSFSWKSDAFQLWKPYHPYFNCLLVVHVYMSGADPAQNLTGSNRNPKNFDRHKAGRKIF